MAFNSGSDSSLLYDSLQALGREGEIGEREASARALSLRVAAASSLIGGFSAGIDLRLGHALSAAAGLVAVVAAWRMIEPPRSADAEIGLAATARAVRSALSDRVVIWVTAFLVVSTVSIHVPYELVQPWLSALSSALDRPDYSAAPAIAGVVTAIVAALAAWASARAPGLSRRFGPRAVLVGSGALMIAVTAAMRWVHPIVLLPPRPALRSRRPVRAPSQPR